MGLTNEYARVRTLEYRVALHAVGLEPGDIAHMMCPSCSAPFVLELPASDQDLRGVPAVLDGEVPVTCANHCFTQWSLAEFQPRLTATPPSEWIENKHCTRYWTDTPGSRCPLCGMENYREVLKRQVLKVRGLVDGIDQDAVIDATKDLVAVFDGVMRAMVRGHTANLAHARSQLGQPPVVAGFASSGPVEFVDLAERWPESISFQNLPGARKNLLEGTCSCIQWHRGAQIDTCLTGSDIRQWVTAELGADSWHDAARVFQKRHLFQHGLGAADAQYIERTNDHTVRIGQIVRIGADELDVAAQACELVGNRFFAAYLS